ncbi:MAG: hypothetical protein M3436_14010 [Pseudomonadota bacterium]|nr:hypothetical protein [Pseudomonadota bacterium]
MRTNGAEESSFPDAVAEHLARTDGPVPLLTLGTRLRKAGVPMKNDKLSAILKQFAQEGRAFEHPVGRQSRNPIPRYWHRSAEEYVERMLAQALAGGGEWTEGKLRQKLPKAYRDIVDEAIGRFLSAGRLFEGPAKGKTRKLSTRPPVPSEALGAAQIRSLRTILERINALRRPPLRFELLVAFLDGRLSGPDRPVHSGRITEDLLLRFYAEDLPRREGLKSMPIPCTWRRYVDYCKRAAAVPDRQGFHRLLNELSAAGRVALAVHDSPSRLSQEDLEAAERTPEGRVVYYWTPLGGTR